jgi:hypothetical protein
LEIVEVTFGNGHADVVIQGEYFAMSDAQPCAASLQILMTVFANPSVQTASVTLNGAPIGNRCFFGPPELHTLPLFEEEPRPSGDADARAYPLCAARPSP